MAKHTIVTSASFMVLVLLNLVPLNSGVAQNSEGRWVLGFHGGPNIWLNDYSTTVIGAGGEVMLRYGITPALSAGILAGYEELKSKQQPAIAGKPDYLKLHAIPAAAALWIHFGSGKTVSPYIYAGFGAMIYKRLSGGGVYLPDSKFSTSILVPLGAGLEIFASNKTSFVIDAGYRITDDYTDALKVGKLDGYATAKIGVNLYFGTSKAESQALRDAEARRIKELAENEARRVKEQAENEARRVKELAEAEAKRLKDLADAEARRLAALKGRDTTIIVLEKGKTVILKGVNFEFNKATLTQFSENILERALKALQFSPDLNVLIVGHTDNVGSARYNKKLSLRRAEAVKSWLVARGIVAKRLSVAGKGFDEPIDNNNTAEGRTNNRRIEFRVLE